MRIRTYWHTRKAMAQLRSIEETIKSSSEEAKTEVAEKIVRYANENLEVRSKNPTMWSMLKAVPAIKNSWQIERRGDKVHIKNTSKHSFVVEYGHAMIIPKRVKTLHWQDLSGNDVFAKYTNPVPPMHYFRDAMNRAEKEFKSDVIKSITKGLSFKKKIKV